MSVACPKCSYIRRETDEAPDWQCPKCGIAIAKYIELQRQAAERKTAKPEPAQREVVKPEIAYGMLDDAASSIGRKIVYWISWLLAAGLVRYLFTLYHAQPPTPPAQAAAPASPLAQAAARQAAAPLVPPLVPSTPGDPILPTDSFRDLFVAAHQQGVVNGIALVTGDVTGIPGIDRIKPVEVHVERREPLAMSGCDRFGVTLTQGGGQHVNTRGQAVKTAYSMHFVYSLNYCVDGTKPAAGWEIKVEAPR